MSRAVMTPRLWCLPLGILDNASVLRPSKPSWAWLSLLLLVEYADDTRYITTMGGFGNAPHSEVAI
jgi:hypothetical protein